MHGIPRQTPSHHHAPDPARPPPSLHHHAHDPAPPPPQRIGRETHRGRTPSRTSAAETQSARALPQTLAGKVALVTGASSGIGRATALELARRGAKIVASARRSTAIESLVAQIRKEAFEATAVTADINVEQDVIDLVATTIATYGRIDIAFNNAGTEGEFTPFVDQTNLARTASIEWFKHGVRVNNIAPGMIDTPFQDRIWPSEQVKKDVGATSVAGRMGTPEEIAKAGAFLASDDASFVTGHGLIADGGLTIA